jgi:pyruvate formate lyase activating enzyme
MQISGIKKSTLLDYPGKVATLIFTPGCNLRCGYCHNREFVLPEEIKKIKKSFISEEIFFRFLRSRIGFLDGVVIC